MGGRLTGYHFYGEELGYDRNKECINSVFLFLGIYPKEFPTCTYKATRVKVF